MKISEQIEKLDAKIAEDIKPVMKLMEAVKKIPQEDIEMIKKLSIAALIDMKEKINKRKNEIKEMEIESLGAVFRYKTATRAEMANFKDLDLLDVDPYNVYSHVVEPDLKDKELQAAYNKGGKPYMIVDKLLTPKEVSSLSLAIVGEGKQEDLSKKVKN